jgi:hypothetical protein
MENKTVTSEELDALKAISDKNDRCVVELGRIEYQKTILEQESHQIKQTIIELIASEKQFSDQLIAKYGDIKVDLETGIIS